MTIVSQVINGHWFSYEENLNGMRVVDALEDIDLDVLDVEDLKEADALLIELFNL
jgi:hypothetical protein